MILSKMELAYIYFIRSAFLLMIHDEILSQNHTSKFFRSIQINDISVVTHFELL